MATAKHASIQINVLPAHTLMSFVFSRSQLMDLIWEDAEDTLERTVDAHIKTLRAKLRQVNPNEAIVTHHGMGYSLSFA